MSPLSIFRSAIRRNAKFLSPGLRVLSNLSRKYSADIGHAKGSTDTMDTMNDVKYKIMERLGLETGYVPRPKPRDHLLQYEPKFEDLPPRSMQDSFTSAIIPLSQSKALQDRYVNVMGHVRLGRIMEDMDMFAVWVCHQHLKIPKLDPAIHLPYTFVTILVDKVSFTEFSPRATHDIRLSGHVSWVGRSSMEIVVWVEQISEGKYEKITRALFLMGARNATNTKSAPVNPLVPANERETLILSGGKERKRRRQELRESSLLKVEPNDEEQTLMHNLFIKTAQTDTMELNSRLLPENSRWIGDTSVASTMACFPENRNAHNKVFGGFIMRNALEISWVCATLHCGSRPKQETICDIRFQKPIHVSSFLKINAHVVYTEDRFIQIMTIVDILDLSGKQATSNVFSYTYRAPGKVQTVYPRSYDEMLWYIEGRRKFRYARTSE